MNNLETKQLILKKIKEYSKIIIIRHILPDGDCVGASIGLRHIIKDTFLDKNVKILVEDFTTHTNFLGEEDEAQEEEYYRDALVISVDCATKKRISNRFFTSAKEIIKIDHHIETDPYGTINWVEDFRCSSCEMLVDFYLTFKDMLVLSKEAATALYVGIVSDSGRFRFSSVKGETLRLASVLLDKGIDTEHMFANLYIKDYSMMILQRDLYKRIRITPNGVCYIYINKRLQKKHNISSADASSVINMIDSIKGSILWIAFIDNDDKSIRVRLRSRFMTVNQIGEKYHGGGHAKASGATAYSKKEMRALINDADLEIKKYKEMNDDWL